MKATGSDVTGALVVPGVSGAKRRTPHRGGARTEDSTDVGGVSAASSRRPGRHDPPHGHCQRGDRPRRRRPAANPTGCPTVLLDPGPDTHTLLVYAASPGSELRQSCSFGECLRERRTLNPDEFVRTAAEVDEGGRQVVRTVRLITTSSNCDCSGRVREFGLPGRLQPRRSDVRAVGRRHESVRGPGGVVSARLLNPCSV